MSGVSGVGAILGAMPPRKRPLDRKNRRLTIEVYAEDEEVLHRARVAAVEQRVPLREWIFEAIRRHLERQGDQRDS